MSSTNFSITNGTPFPLGATASESGVNFSIWAPKANAVDLCVFNDLTQTDLETDRIRMEGFHGGTWFTKVSGLNEGCRYGYRVQGEWAPDKGLFFNHHKLLLDPYAKWITTPSLHHDTMISRNEEHPDQMDSGPYAPKARVPSHETFDWEGTERPAIPMSDSVFYETHVKGFSHTNPNVPENLRGTYAGLAHGENLKYFRNLGITSVQLLPVHQHMDDGFLLERELVNYWGYNTLGYFAPEVRYSATGNPVIEFKEMVRAFHREGIEVILDVVYNHTCEGGVNGPTCLFRGFDNEAYYRTSTTDPSEYDDVTGCGNSVDISQRDSMQLVLDSLRYWVTEMGVDGFRFDLAATLGRDPSGFTTDAAFFRAAYQDPVLKQVKLIAEPWDIGLGGYQQGNFPSDWNELNGQFRDCVRQFWRGDPNVVGEFATRITGSADMFAHNGRSPQFSLNMVTSHDGFTLRDLVSYNQKHNDANGENNRDGDSHNISFNHGAEGETDDPEIVDIRKRQVRNFLATLICSQGVPFITAGDERFRTQQGNNNAYCQDSEISWLNWDSSDKAATSMNRFVRKMLAFRRDNPSLRKQRFFTGNHMNGTGLKDVTWLNSQGDLMSDEDWKVNESGAFAMMIHREASFRHQPLSGFLILFYNARQQPCDFSFPETPDFKWECIVDTVDDEGEPQEDFAEPGKTIKLAERSMQIWREIG